MRQKFRLAPDRGTDIITLYFTSVALAVCHLI